MSYIPSALTAPPLDLNVLKLLPPGDSERPSRLRRRRRSLARTDGEPTKKWYVTPVGAEPSEEDPEIPDILHVERQAWGDLQGVAQLVRFAFEGGECTGVFDAIVDATPASPSSWHPAAFAAHLFLDDLVRSSFPVEIEGTAYPTHHAFLVGLLSRPPSASQDTRARQDVFAELLDHPSARVDLERAYEAVYRLRSRLECSPMDEADSVTRKLDVLRAIRDCVDALAEGFDEAASVLSRLREAGLRLRATQDYERLVQLLDLERNLATVDVRLRLGADGHVRGLQLLRVKENGENPLLPGTWRRMWQRVKGVAQGHRYGQREVVAALFHEVFAPLVDAVVTCLALSGPMEFYLAGLGFRDRAAKRDLAVCLPDIVDAPLPDEDRGVERVLEGVFNPLLVLQDVTPVPADVKVDRHDALVLLTGPNSGGKTRVLQAIAIVQCLGQVGMFVPASRARLVRAPTLFVSLVDEVDAAQTEGRLGTELVRIRKLFEELQPGAMALIDELCSGTNPTEGEEIAEMVISLLPKLHPQVFISTHFLGLAQRIERERPVERLAFLEVELDADNRPTFAFVPGVAKTSLAHMLAARLGVTREELERIVAEKDVRGSGPDRRP